MSVHPPAGYATLLEYNRVVAAVVERIDARNPLASRRMCEYLGTTYTELARDLNAGACSSELCDRVMNAVKNLLRHIHFVTDGLPLGPGRA